MKYYFSGRCTYSMMSMIDDTLLIDICDDLVHQWARRAPPEFRTPAISRLLFAHRTLLGVTLPSPLATAPQNDSPSTSSFSSSSSPSSNTNIKEIIRSPPPAPPISTLEPRRITAAGEIEPTSPKIPCGQVTLSRNHCVHVIIQSPTSLKENKDVISNSQVRQQQTTTRTSPPTSTSSTPTTTTSSPTSPRRSNNTLVQRRKIQQSISTAVALTQPYKAESNHRDYTTKASMDRARQFIQSLKRVESIVMTAMSSSKDRTKQAQNVLSSLDTHHTGMLDRRTFSLACRRLQLGLSRTDIDALIAFLRSRKFASQSASQSGSASGSSSSSSSSSSHGSGGDLKQRRGLKQGCIRWRWFMIQFCGAKYTPSEASPTMLYPKKQQQQQYQYQNQQQNQHQQHDYNRVINNHRPSTKKKQHRRPRTADTLQKARQRMQQQKMQRPASSGARDTRLRRRGGGTQAHNHQHPLTGGGGGGSNKVHQQRPSSVPYKKGRKKDGGGSLASMASALQRGNGQDWTFFGGERRSPKDIANMMLRTPTSPSKIKKKRASPLLTARLRPFFGTVYNSNNPSK